MSDGWDFMDIAEFSDDEEGEERGSAPPGPGQDLVEFGVTVLPAFDHEARVHWETRLYAAMDAFPEYRVRGRNVPRVLGGFGALGNPSSFHHPTVRTLRRIRKKVLFRPLMASFVQRKFPGEASNILLEALFDRLCVRCEAFGRPADEMWHRGIYDAEQYRLRALPRSLPRGEEDLLFGGWTNMDHRDQHFVGIVSSHNDTATGKKAFAEFSKGEVKTFRFNERLKAQADRTFGQTLRTDKRGHIIVPPGHAVVFIQRLIHGAPRESQPDTPALRVFHGLRLTRETKPLFDIGAVIAYGGVPRVPSGQLAAMYSPNHYKWFRTEEHYRTWGARTFHAACLFKRTTSDGTTYFTPGSAGDANPFANLQRIMPSLSEMGLWNDSFRYSRREERAMYPQRILEEGEATRLPPPVTELRSRPTPFDVVLNENEAAYASHVKVGTVWIGGLFAKRDLVPGEFIAKYDGKLLTPKEANAVTSDYLMAATDTRDGRRRWVIDGHPKFGGLAGFANYAANRVANAAFEDRGMDRRFFECTTNVVLISKVPIAARQEIRVDYDTGTTGRPFRHYMLRQGISPSELDDPGYTVPRWAYPREQRG